MCSLYDCGAHKTLDFELSNQNMYNSTTRIVIANELKPPNHRREIKDPLSSPELLSMPNYYFFSIFDISFTLTIQYNSSTRSSTFGSTTNHVSFG